MGGGPDVDADLGGCSFGGLAIGLLQALTSVQELTLTFVPKLIAILIVFFLTSGYMTQILLDLFQNQVLAVASR